MVTYGLLRRGNEPRHRQHSRRTGTVFDLYHHPAYLRKAVAPNPSTATSSSGGDKKRGKEVRQEWKKPGRKAGTISPAADGNDGAQRISPATS